MQSSAQHHQEAGTHQLMHEQRQVTKDIDVKMKRANEQTFNQLREDFEAENLRDTDLDLIHNDEEFVDEKFEAYSKKKLLSMKLTKHIQSNKAIDSLVSSMVPPNINLKMHYGDGWTGRTSYKG